MSRMRAFAASRSLLACAVAAALLCAGRAAVAQPTREELTIYVNEVTTWSPGYAMGDIVLGSPETAGYEPVGNRRQLMLRGKAEGQTTLSIWDQRKVLRHEITLVVRTREADQAQAELKALLEPYPDVTVRRLGGSTILSGTVASSDDLEAVNNIASAAGITSAVRVKAGAGRPSDSGASAGSGTGTGSGTAVSDAVATEPSAGTTTRPAAPATIVYDLELFEASSQFQTGSYDSGVEPSGRSLYKAKVSATVGGDGQIFIGGPAIDPKQKGDKTQSNTGIRLTVRPRQSEEGLVTAVEVETNVPLQYELYDPNVWRRSRYSFSTTEKVPFALSGNDLLAAPDVAGGSKMAGVRRGSETASNVSGAVSGVTSKGGLQYVPVFGSLLGSNSYKEKKTQLLVVFRPSMTTAAPQP